MGGVDYSAETRTDNSEAVVTDESTKVETVTEDNVETTEAN